MIAQAEVEPQVVLRQIAAAAPHFIGLREIAGDDFDSRIQRQSVALRPGEFEADPVIARAAFGTKDHRLAFEILDHNFLDAVIEQIADSQAASHSRNLQRRSRLVAHIAERAVALIQEQLAGSRK